tara:strand:- start:929 stop:1960 length:1032 start_codon:yes stop_codon:yes gene_type:complete
MLIQAEPLTEIVSGIFQKMGSPAGEAEMVAASLVKANLMGHDSHGVGLVASYIRHFQAGLLLPGMSSKCVKDDGAIMMFDGQRGFGRRVGGEAMQMATERCRDTGVVLLTLKNAHHLGRIGAYGEIAMAEGLISLHFVNVTDHPPSVAPWGGIESRFVTNPICVAIPGTEETPPTLLDMATSRIAIGKARVAMSKGDKLDPGMVVDSDGKPTTDPAVMYQSPRGALLPFGEHKGSGLALICELLAGGLSGGGTIQPQNPRQASIVNNMFAFLVDPTRLVDIEWLRAEIDATVAYVKSARPVTGAQPILVAGDKERIETAMRSADGIDVNDEAWEEMHQAASEL